MIPRRDGRMDDRCTKKYQTQAEAETEERVRKYGGVDKERGRRRERAEEEGRQKEKLTVR